MKEINNAVLYTEKTSDLIYKNGIKREDFKNTFEYILARDGFIYGCDYNWPADVEYVNHCLGDNHIAFDGNQTATFNRYQAFTDIYNIHAIGFNAVNYWILSSLQGITFDQEGFAIGLDENFLENLRSVLDICREIGIAVVPSMQPHGSANSWGGKNSRGESAVYVWNKYFKFIWYKKAREMYINNVIKPVCKVFAEYQDIILCVGLTIENDTGWVSDMDLGYYQSDIGTTWEVWTDFLNTLHDCVKEAAPFMLTSTEEAGGTEKLARLSELKVDLIGGNYYHEGSYVPPRELYVTTRPGYIGEFNVGDYHGNNYLGVRWGKKRHEFFKTAKESGWIGGFFFRYSSDHGDCTMFDPEGSTLSYEHLYEWGYGFRYVIADGIAKHRGFAPEIEIPSIMANKGSKEVYWIPSRTSDFYRLERSLDGGNSWEVISEKIEGKIASVKNGLIKYVDETITEGMEYCYRVAAVMPNGKEAMSKPNNTEKYYVAENMLQNSDFATGDFSAWVTGTHKGEIEKTDEGYLYKIDYSNKDTVNQYGSIYQILNLKPATAYRVSFKFKLDFIRAGGEHAHVKAWNIKRNSNMNTCYMASIKKDKSEFGIWHSRSFNFVTTDTDTEIMIQLNQGMECDSGVIYVSDLSVKELR